MDKKKNKLKDSLPKADVEFARDNDGLEKKALQALKSQNK